MDGWNKYYTTDGYRIFKLEEEGEEVDEIITEDKAKAIICELELCLEEIEDKK